jgi:hypothetical protein
MKIAVVSYSYTGNNDRLAACVARDLSVENIKITTQKPMTMGRIILDMIFNRTPKVHPNPDLLKQYDLILFFAPVWIGHIASPLRPYLHAEKSHSKAYGFFSISGGADGDNSKLLPELLKRTGMRPTIMLDQHIKDFIRQNTNPTRKDTSAYKISEAEASSLSAAAIKEINKLNMHG